MSPRHILKTKWRTFEAKPVKPINNLFPTPIAKGMVNAESLKKIAITGAAISCLGAAFFHHRIQANIASQDYYKKSVEVLRNHQLASDTIGKPIRIPYLNLARNDIRVGNKTAQIVIPVRGSKSSGNLYSYATRTDSEGWVLERVELEAGPEHHRIRIMPED